MNINELYEHLKRQRHGEMPVYTEIIGSIENDDAQVEHETFAYNNGAYDQSYVNTVVLLHDNAALRAKYAALQDAARKIAQSPAVIFTSSLEPELIEVLRGLLDSDREGDEDDE